MRQAKQGHAEDYPTGIKTAGQKALFDNLGGDADAARAVDEALRENAPYGWRDNKTKERLINRRIVNALPEGIEAELIFEIVKAQHEY